MTGRRHRQRREPLGVPAGAFPVYQGTSARCLPSPGMPGRIERERSLVRFDSIVPGFVPGLGSMFALRALLA
jgi:hypothetical protein